MKHQRSLVSTFVLSLLLLPIAANASLIGNVVDCDGNGLLQCALPGSTTGGDISNTVSGINPEFDLLNINDLALFGIDLADSSITIESNLNLDLSGFGSISLRSLEWADVPDGNITGVSLSTQGVSTSTQPNTDGTSLTIDDITFGDDFVTIFMAHTKWVQGASATVSLTTTHSPAVPAPSAMLLLGTGLAALVGWRWRDNRLGKN